MKILFSYPSELKGEVSIINREMKTGNWDFFHLRKPTWSENEKIGLYNQFDEVVRYKTVFHHSSGSCHSFDEVEKIDGEMDYCFLSPIYDSISKGGYKANFEELALKEFLKKERQIKVIALGGVTEDNYSKLLELGFDGGAFLGSVWKKHE